MCWHWHVMTHSSPDEYQPICLPHPTCMTWLMFVNCKGELSHIVMMSLFTQTPHILPNPNLARIWGHGHLIKLPSMIECFYSGIFFLLFVAVVTVAMTPSQMLYTAVCSGIKNAKHGKKKGDFGMWGVITGIRNNINCEAACLFYS